MIVVRGCNHGSKSRKAHSINGVAGPIPLEEFDIYDGNGKCDVSIGGTGFNGF